MLGTAMAEAAGWKEEMPMSQNKAVAQMKTPAKPPFPGPTPDKIAQHKRLMFEAAEKEFHSYILLGDPDSLDQARAKAHQALDEMLDATVDLINAALAQEAKAQK